jgi:membrane-associated phospholipid phosphatase
MTQSIALRWLVALIFISIYSDLAYARGDIEKTGDVLQIFIAAVGAASTIFYEKGNEGIIQFSEALATSQLVTEGLKIATHKRRPNGGSYNSFPSGHASAAFMGAGFIHKRYGWKYAIPAYIGATYVGYSRVEADKHYVEDVVAGALLGTLSSFYFTEPYNKEFSITPIARQGVYGATISWSW